MIPLATGESSRARSWDGPLPPDGEVRWNLMVDPHPVLAQRPKIVRLFLKASEPNEDSDHDRT